MIRDQAAMQDFTDETDEDIEAFIIMCILCDLAHSVQCRARVGNILRDRAVAMHLYSTYTHKDFNFQVQFLSWDSLQ